MLYTDDDLVVSNEEEDIVRNQIGKHFVVKKGSVGHTNRHLNGIVRKVQLKNMANDWAFSSSQYVRATTDNVENYLNNKGTSFPKSCDSPLPTLCRPELDVTPEISVEDVSHFSLSLEF